MTSSREFQASPTEGTALEMAQAQDDSLPHTAASIDIERRFSAWLCVLGSFVFLITSFGMMNSIGVLQSYLELNELKNHTTSEVGWITGMYMFLGLFLSIQVGPLLDRYGPILLSIVGTISTIATYLILAECKAYWHFMLCFGVLGGLGSAITGVVAVAIVGKLFIRLRGLAMSVALSGSSTGSIIITMMLRSLLEDKGWKWSMRILAIFFAGILIPGILCFLPFRQFAKILFPDEPTRPRSSAVLNFAAFKKPEFLLVTGGLFTLEFVLFGVGGLLPTISTGAGFKPEDGYILLAIIGACSIPGRIFPGMLGDKVGHFNVLLLTILTTVILLGALFLPFGTSNARVLYAFSALWGFCSGSFLSLTPVCLGKTCEAKEFGTYYGTMNFVVSFALLLAIPLSGLMIQNMGAKALVGLFIAIVSLGGGLLCSARALLIGQWFSLKQNI